MGNFIASLFGISNDAAEPKPAEPSEPTGDFVQDLLDTQNTYRSNHGAPTMKLSQKLCQDAQKWADHIAASDNLQHSDDRDGAGENLAWGSGGLGGGDAAKMWYDEIKDYDFGNPGFSGKTGHFTQVVWKGSVEFGGAKATSSSGGTYIVGRYYPAGNMAGDFEANVLQAS